MKTGAEYLEGLRDGRKVYMDGRPVEDVTVTPGLGELAHTVARLHDQQHEGEYAELFSFTDEHGRRLSRAWQRPRSPEELMVRQRYTQAQGRLTGGLFGRLPEYVPLFHLGMLDVKDAFGQGDERYVANIARYYDSAAEQDLTLSHAFVDIQTASDVDLDDTPMLRVTREGESGLIVNGVKSIGTFVAQSDEVLVGTFPRGGLKDHHVVYFSVRVNTEGVKIVSRSPHAIGEGEFNHPVSRLGDENDTLLIFEDVEVPWERVFQYGAGASFALRTFPLISEWAHWSILARLATKAEMMVGLFSALPALLGRSKRSDAQEWYGEAVRYLITLRAFLDSAAHRGGLTPAGHFMPSPDIVTAGRCYGVEHYRRIIGGLQDLMGQAFINAPTEAALLSPEIGAVLQSVYGGSEQAALDRVRLTRLGIDLTSGSFGGRQTLFEIFNATGVATIRSQLSARFRSAPYAELAYATAGIGDVDQAIRDIEADWAPGTQLGDIGLYDAVGDAYTSAAR